MCVHHIIYGTYLNIYKHRKLYSIYYIKCTHVYAIAAKNNRVFDRRNMGRVSSLLHLQYH